MTRFKRILHSSLAKNSLIYVVSDGINRAIPFLLLPFITRYLTPEAYGIVTNFNVYVQILTVFIYSCTVGALQVMFFKLNKEDLKYYVSNMIFLNSIATIICLVINLFLHKWITRGLDINLTFQLYAILTVWFSGITFINMVLWRCEEKPLSFGIYQISQSAVNAITTIIFVIILLLGWQGRVYSMMCSSIIFGTFSLYILFRRGYLELNINKEYLIQVTLFALPIMPHALSFWFRGGVEKILLSNMSGLSENGLYSVALTWGSVVNMFLVAINNAYIPFLFKKLAYFDADKDGTLSQQLQIVKIIKVYLLGTAVFVTISYFTSYWLIKIIYPPDYYGSLSFLPWVMISQLFQGCYLLFACFPNYKFKTKPLGIITFSWSIIACLLAWLCILLWGPVGVSISSAFVSLAIFISVAILATKVYTLPWNELLTFRI